MQLMQLNFRGRRDQHTRDFFRESRIMTEAFPELYSPEKPYERRRNASSRAEGWRNVGESKHIYKLMGSLYEPKKKVESDDEVEIDP